MTVHRYGVSLPEAVPEILMRNRPAYQCFKMKLMNSHSLAQTHLVPSPAAETAEYTAPIGGE